MCDFKDDLIKILLSWGEMPGCPCQVVTWGRGRISGQRVLGLCLLCPGSGCLAVIWASVHCNYRKADHTLAWLPHYPARVKDTRFTLAAWLSWCILAGTSTLSLGRWDVEVDTHCLAVRWRTASAQSGTIRQAQT